MAAAEADSRAISDEVDRYIRKYRKLKEEYEDLFGTQRELAKQEMEAVFRENV